MHDIRSLIGRLNFMANARAQSETMRRALLGTVKLLKSPSTARQQIEGMASFAAQHEALTEAWLEPEDLSAPRTGSAGFDACDLRIWLAVADMAGVPAVPGRVILSLHEDEFSALEQKTRIPEVFRKRFQKGVEAAFTAKERAEIEAEAEKIRAKEEKLDGAAIYESLFDAMDDVPAGWMVRTNICGPSNLKAMAGAGVVDLDLGGDGASWQPPAPAGRDDLSGGLEIGPGWVRNGNRRRIDATDHRYVEGAFTGHKSTMHYIARPWMKAARRHEGPDPHRHGTPFAGKGSWPCEWRCYIENGRVTGVACYYAWCGTVTPLDAAKALEARRLAEQMIAQMQALQVAPELFEIEAVRDATEKALADGVNPSDLHPDCHLLLARYPKGGITCTLDFIEADTQDGPKMLLLEGGPGHTLLGGGHPTGFAGHKSDARGICVCEGVALRLMENVILADPATWSSAKTSEGHVLSWQEAEALAEAA